MNVFTASAGGGEMPHAAGNGQEEEGQQPGQGVGRINIFPCGIKIWSIFIVILFIESFSSSALLRKGGHDDDTAGKRCFRLQKVELCILPQLIKHALKLRAGKNVLLSGRERVDLLGRRKSLPICHHSRLLFSAGKFFSLLSFLLSSVFPPTLDG